MSNGKPRDAPFTDIVYHELSVFHPKVDQLIRDLNVAGAFEDPFAREYINVKARYIEALPKAHGWAPEEAEARRKVVLGNWARELHHRLRVLEGEPAQSENRLIPLEYDPDPGPHREL